MEDADAIADVHVASWRWAYEGLMPEDVLATISVDKRTAMWREVIPRGGVVVAEDSGGSLVGFASVGPTTQDDAVPGTGELFAIYLAQEAAGRGIGQSLLHRAEENLRAAGFDRAMLWVLAADDRARRFYERNGWSIDGATDTSDIKGNPMTEVRMVRNL